MDFDFCHSIESSQRDFRLKIQLASIFSEVNEQNLRPNLESLNLRDPKFGEFNYLALKPDLIDYFD